jgi:hypothetical protein
VFSRAQNPIHTPWSALKYSCLVAEERGKWTRGDHFHQPRSVPIVFVERGGDGHVTRWYRLYFQSYGELRDEAQLRGPTIGRRVVPPEVAGVVIAVGA